MASTTRSAAATPSRSVAVVDARRGRPSRPRPRSCPSPRACARLLSIVASARSRSGLVEVAQDHGVAVLRRRPGRCRCPSCPRRRRRPRAAHAAQTRSTARATPLPPPRQSARCRAARRGRLQRVEQRGQDARAAGADGMAEGHRAAVDVDLGGVEPELAADGDACTAKASFSSKRSTLAGAPARLLPELPDRLAPAPSSPASARGRATAWATMRASGVRPRALGRLRRRDDQRGGAVVHAGRVARGDRAALLEGGLELGQRLQRRVLARRLVGRERAPARPSSAGSAPAGSRP